MDKVHIADTIHEVQERTSFLNHAVLCMSACVEDGLTPSEEDLMGLWRCMYDVKVLVQKIEKAYTIAET